MMKLNLTDGQKNSIVENLDTRMLPFPSRGWHLFRVSNVFVKHDEVYGELISCDIQAECLDEESKRPMMMRFTSAEKDIVRLGNIYAALVLGRAYNRDDIDAEKFIGKSFRGEVQSFEKYDETTGEDVEITYLSKYIQAVAEAEKGEVVEAPAPTKTIETPAPTPTPAEKPALSAEELDAIING